jgi:hypothetical protein
VLKGAKRMSMNKCLECGRSTQLDDGELCYVCGKIAGQNLLGLADWVVDNAIEEARIRRAERKGQCGN